MTWSVLVRDNATGDIRYVDSAESEHDAAKVDLDAQFEKIADTSMLLYMIDRQ